MMYGCGYLKLLVISNSGIVMPSELSKLRQKTDCSVSVELQSFTSFTIKFGKIEQQYT